MSKEPPIPDVPEPKAPPPKPIASTASAMIIPENADMSPPADLTGLIDCFHVTACDPTSMLCIKYLTGTPGNPGPPRQAPACFAPADPCPNGVLDCACIQADMSLAMYCTTCFDNGDRSFTCYGS
jgi:hypothetical protein